MAQEKYISLKEAAKISGYSPDYVGQLIRRGKLHGKQVFLNVAWVTTEDALRSYMDGQSAATIPRGPLERMLAHINVEAVYKALFGIVFVLLLGFMMLLGYIFSVSIDHKIEQGYQAQLDSNL